ncbi:hypothetical protein [Bacillus sp. FJAT-50079]|uniref:hypothetical protein n=1 Tax=Bacillus sp. FJAT-50079 TaxID=2833577 RepID=UPI001BC90C5B|nr:hypothetical protein [Bacillus sp. FJAT-50079]MBS4207236.1 hypothetical protein [Bacillus sp. FJAT-50079]
MILTPYQQLVLHVLSAEWQTPIQLVNQIPKESGNLSDVQQALKDLLHEGLVQVNPVVLGMYRLTSDGTATKADLLEK